MSQAKPNPNPNPMSKLTDAERVDLAQHARRVFLQCRAEMAVSLSSGRPQEFQLAMIAFGAQVLSSLARYDAGPEAVRALKVLIEADSRLPEAPPAENYFNDGGAIHPEKGA